MTSLSRWEGEPLHVWAERWRSPLVEVHDELGSTNDRARVLVAEGAPPFSVVLAEAQRSGRGRRGASWHSPAGAGLWISVVLPGADPAAGPLPLLVGLAAARAAEEACGGLRVGIEWPNDLVVGDRKVGGVLCEGAPGGVIAGVGINVRQRPADFPRELAARASSLEAEAGSPASRGDLATSLLHHLHDLCADGGRVIPAVALAELGSRDSLRNRPVRSETEGRGLARGIASDGALVMERSDGSRVWVRAGSVRAVRE